MEPNASDETVPRKIAVLLLGDRFVPRKAQRAITPFGGVAVVITCLRKIDLAEQIRRHMPIWWKSPHQIDPATTPVAFVMAVLVGTRRLAHAGLLRGDRARPSLLGIERFLIDDTVRNLLRAFSICQV